MGRYSLEPQKKQGRYSLAPPEEEEEKNIIEPPKPATGWKGIAQDVSGLPSKAFEFAVSSPRKLGESAGQLFNNPVRAGGNLLAGLGEAGIGFVNSAHNALKYLGEKEVIPDWLKKYNELPFTHVPDLGIEKKLFGEQKPGDEMLRLIGALAPIPKIRGLTTKPKKLELNELKNKLEQSGMKVSGAEKELEEAKNASLRDFRTHNPYLLENSLNTTKEKVNELKPNIDNPVNEPVLNPHEIPGLHEYEPQSPGTESLLKTKEQKLAEAEKKLNTYLGEGQIHHERFATEVKEGREKLENQNTSNYKAVDKQLEGKNVQVKNNEIANKILKNVEQDTSDNFLSSLGLSTPKEKMIPSIPAKDFLAAYRKVRNESYEQLMFARENPNTELGQKAYEKHLKLKKHEEDMHSLLKESMGEDIYKDFRKAQDYFKDTIAPMRQNSTFREVQKKGKVSGSLLEKSVGTEVGQDILQNMIHQNPEMMRLAVGHEYAGKVNNLYKPNELLEKRYFPRMSELQNLMKEHHGARQEHEHAAAQHEQATSHDKEQENIASLKVKFRDNAIKEQEKEHKKLTDQYTKDKITYDKHAKMYSDGLEKIKSLEETIPNLKLKAEKVKQSLEDKHKNMLAYEKARDDLYKTRALVKKATKVVIKIGKKLSAL
jgi:hypothetical protein